MNISRRELLLGIGAAPLVLKAQRVVAAQAGRHLHDLLQVLPRPAHRRPLPRRLRLERHAPSSGDGSGLALRRPDRRRRRQQDAAERVSVDEDVSDDRRGADARRQQARGRRRAARRRARPLSAQREGPDACTRATSSSSRSSRSSRQRPLRAGLQRQAPLVELGMGEGDVRHVAAHGIPADGGLEPAGDVADAVARDAARARGFAKRSASATAASTATTSTASRRSSAWSSGGEAARPASSGCRPIAARRSGKRTRKASGRGTWSRPRSAAATR